MTARVTEFLLRIGFSKEEVAEVNKFIVYGLLGVASCVFIVIMIMFVIKFGYFLFQ